MEKLTIQTLNIMVRGFSNEVTVNWLASKLGISYSTLVRCKNGVWPRSVTRQAMKGVFDECRDRFFDGDGEKLAAYSLEHLERDGVDVGRFRNVLEANGYDAFALELIEAAHTSGAGSDSLSPSASAHNPESPRHDESAQDFATRHLVANGGELSSQSLLTYVGVALPVAVILLVGLLNVSVETLLSWAASHEVAFIAVLLALAVSPVVFGALVDAPLAWRAFERAHPGVSLTRRDRLAISKFGGVDEVVPGAGRFDLSLRHCGYQACCNALGALCVVSLLGFLNGLPGFAAFFEGREWAEFFKVGIAVGFYVAFSHGRELSALPPCDSVNWAGENPDNYRPNRAHVWANAVHLVVTFSLVCILVLALLAYSVVNFRAIAPSLGILWPYAQTMAFLAYSSASPYAERVEALGVGAFVPGVAASSIGVVALTLTCYLPSWEGAVICAACAASLAVVLVWRGSHKADGEDSWVSRSAKSGAYSIAVVMSLAVMLAIGSATAVLL